MFNLKLKRYKELKKWKKWINIQNTDKEIKGIWLKTKWVTLRYIPGIIVGISKSVLF